MSSDAWRLPPVRLDPDAQVVDVWRVRLDTLSHQIRTLTALLSEREIRRGERYRFQRDRDSYLISHACLRLILARYLGTRAEQVCFAHGPRGKPYVAPEPGHAGLQFNMAASHGMALYGVCVGRDIGVDLEWMHSDRVDEGLITQLLSPEERRELMQVPEGDRRRAFYACWTRKEAYLKAMGEGLYYPLDQFSVSVGPEHSPRLLHVGHSAQEAERWSLRSLDVWEGYAATLVVEGRGWRLRGWELDSHSVEYLIGHGR